MTVRELIVQLLKQDMDDEIKIAVQSEQYKEHNDIEGIIEPERGITAIVGDFELEYK